MVGYTGFTVYLAAVAGAFFGTALERTLAALSGIQGLLWPAWTAAGFFAAFAVVIAIAERRPMRPLF